MEGNADRKKREKGIDVIAYKGDNFVSVQVKTLSKENPVPLGNNLEKILKNSGKYWVVVVLNKERKPNEAFVMLREEIKAQERKNKDGKVSFWLQPTEYKIFKNCWDKIK